MHLLAVVGTALLLLPTRIIAQIAMQISVSMWRLKRLNRLRRPCPKPLKM